ncbi:MAG: phage late control D family protein [Thermodesulfobacteriota bacterium]
MAEDNRLNIGKFTLLLNGTELTGELISAVEAVTIEDEINLPAMFTISFNIDDFFKGAWRGIDLETFKLGDEIQVMMGMDESEEMLIGEITALEPSFGQRSSMEIRGYDRLHRLRFGTYRRSFKDMKDSDIASTIASEADLSAEVDDTETVHPYVFQNNLSNFEFLTERAGLIDFEMFVDDKTFIFRKSQEDKTAELTLEYGIELESISLNLRTLTEGSEVEVRGWDVMNKEEITSSASAGSEKSVMGGEKTGYKLSETAFGASSIAIVDDVVIDSTAAEKMAKAKYNSMLRKFITGEGTTLGNPAIRAGKTLEIEGLGDRFSGTYYVVSSVHSYNSSDGYMTKFKVRRTGV